MERRDPSYWEVVTCEVYEFRPFSEEVIALRLRARRQSTGYMRVNYKGCEPLSRRRGVAYIEFARPLWPSVMQGIKYIKTGGYW